MLNSPSGSKHVLAVISAAVGLLVEALLYTFSVQRIPIGDCITLFSLTLVWTPILECILRRRCLDKSHVMSSVLGVIGIFFITRPSFIFPQHVGVQRGMSKRVEDGRRPPALRAG
jgi:drug/metabolite transporter (DMT)-like permease